MKPKRGFRQWARNLDFSVVGFEAPDSWVKYRSRPINLKRVERLVHGPLNFDSVDRAFTWSSTPQGHQFWSDIAHGDATQAQISEAKIFARFLLDEA